MNPDLETDAIAYVESRDPYLAIRGIQKYGRREWWDAVNELIWGAENVC